MTEKHTCISGCANYRKRFWCKGSHLSQEADHTILLYKIDIPNSIYIYDMINQSLIVSTNYMEKVVPNTYIST